MMTDVGDGLLRVSSGGLDNLEVSFLPQARGPGI